MLMLPACPPAVNATRNVLNTPPGVLHITLLSDTHDVPSHDVCPTSTDPDAPYSPSPPPITTVSSPPGNIRFDRPTTHTTPASADTIPVVDPTALPDVTDTRLVHDTECDRKHTTADSDTHSVPSHPVSPTLALPDIEYARNPSIINVIRRSPDTPPFVLPTELTSPASTVNTPDPLPAYVPSVTDTRLVLPP